jgi:CAAX prenyl protease-like protein
MSAPRKNKRDHGFWPYLAPMIAFLLMGSFGDRFPDSLARIVYVAKVAIPGGLFLFFALRGRYPELGGWNPTPGIIVGDVIIGLVGTVIWCGPFLLFPSLRPEEPGFDPEQFGASMVGFTLVVRAIGYAGVTPFIEELFVRSWLLRYIEVFQSRKDFRKVAIGHFAWPSFVITTTYFVFSHLPWEWGVMLAWGLLTMAWFYHRKHIMSLVLVHAVTNGSILAFAVVGSGRVRDITGAVVELWYFV